LKIEFIGHGFETIEVIEAESLAGGAEHPHRTTSGIHLKTAEALRSVHTL
jgi:hypothetical protein